MKQKTKLCSSCLNGENKYPADYLVTGRVDGRPYKANLCEDHLEMLLSDGDELKVIKTYSHEPETI